MKRYCIRKLTYTFDLNLCDRFIERMEREGFELIMIKSFGRFYFEYNPEIKKCRYFAFININGLFGVKQLSYVTSEVKRIFSTVEPIRKGTTLTVYRLDSSQQKNKNYLLHMAQERGMNEFEYEKYLNLLREERNKILRNNRMFIASILGGLSLVLMLCGIFAGKVAFIVAALPLPFAVHNAFQAVKFAKSCKLS